MEVGADKGRRSLGWLRRPASPDGSISTSLVNTAPAMSFYLAEGSRRHPDEHILMFLDRAGWHQSKALVVPANLALEWLPV